MPAVVLVVVGVGEATGVATVGAAEGTGDIACGVAIVVCSQEMIGIVNGRLGIAFGEALEGTGIIITGAQSKAFVCRSVAFDGAPSIRHALPNRSISPASRNRTAGLVPARLVASRLSGGRARVVGHPWR